jgi:multidrug efflux pump subunit AcrA (membrane-fusion protein)
VFDPATRTAEMEIEVPNTGFRLKPGMYARVQLTVDTKTDALTVPRNAVVVDPDGKQGVFVAVAGHPGGGSGNARGEGRNPRQTGQRSGAPAGAPAMTAKFVPVETGIRDQERVEIRGGIDDGARVITTGAGALKDGDPVVAAMPEGRRGGRAADAGGPGRNSQGATR